MKLLIVHNRYQHRGGEDLCVDREISALRSAGVHVITHLPESTNTMGGRFKAMASVFHQGEGEELLSLMERERPDILHVHNLFPLLSPRVFLKAENLGIKSVLTLHNYRPLCLNGLCMTPSHEACERCPASHSFLPGILRGCYRRNRIHTLGLAAHLSLAKHFGAYEAVHRFLAPSEFLRSLFLRYGFPDERLVIQPHFLEEFPDAGQPESPPYALYLGRLSDEKGIPWILDVFSRPSSGLPRLVVAGEGPLRKMVKDRRGSHIEYRGHVDGMEKNRLLGGASFLILASECYENLPLAVMESLALGTPVIAPRHGTFQTLIIPGTNGFLFQPGKDEQLRSAASEFLIPGRQAALRISARAFALARYTRDAFLKTRLPFYEKLLH